MTNWTMNEIVSKIGSTGSAPMVALMRDSWVIIGTGSAE